MASDNNTKNSNMQDQQADVLDQTYKLGWMDGYAQGYDDAVEDTEAALNKAENEIELMAELLQKKDKVIDEMASNAGKSLQTAKNR